MDAAKAREQWKTEMRLFVLKGGLGSWPEELKLLRGKWAKKMHGDFHGDMPTGKKARDCKVSSLLSIGREVQLRG